MKKIENLLVEEHCKQCGIVINANFYESPEKLKYCDKKCYNLFTED
jgi:hypothetical protein